MTTFVSIECGDARSRPLRRRCFGLYYELERFASHGRFCDVMVENVKACLGASDVTCSADNGSYCRNQVSLLIRVS